MRHKIASNYGVHSPPALGTKHKIKRILNVFTATNRTLIVCSTPPFSIHTNTHLFVSIFFLVITSNNNITVVKELRSELFCHLLVQVNQACLIYRRRQNVSIMIIQFYYILNPEDVVIGRLFLLVFTYMFLWLT